MRSFIIAAAVMALTAGCASAPSSQGDLDDLFGGGRVSGAQLGARVAAASAHPLGSQENPIRTSMPEGQRAYLRSLRCPDGAAPDFQRVGNFGPGVYGSIIDGYEVRCADAEPVTLFMDMYHPDHVETGAPPGFTRQ